MCTPSPPHAEKLQIRGAVSASWSYSTSTPPRSRMAGEHSPALVCVAFNPQSGPPGVSGKGGCRVPCQVLRGPNKEGLPFTCLPTCPLGASRGAPAMILGLPVQDFLRSASGGEAGSKFGRRRGGVVEEGAPGKGKADANSSRTPSRPGP